MSDQINDCGHCIWWSSRYGDGQGYCMLWRKKRLPGTKICEGYERETT